MLAYGVYGSARRPTSYPRPCGYDIGCCRSKEQGVYHLLVFFLHFSHSTLSKRIASTLAVRTPFRDFCLWATLGKGGVWRNIKFVDIWLLWQLSLRARLEKVHVMPNMSGVVAWLRREFRGASGVIWHALNSAHQRHGILGAQGNLSTRDWRN